MSQPSALITGTSTGIGKAVALSLAKKGFALTLLDIDAAGLERTAAEVRAAAASSGASSTPPTVTTAVLDVTDSAAQDAAVAAHMARHGSLSLAVLNAGIAERGDLFDAQNSSWQRTLDVDLTAVISGVRAAALAIGKTGGGSIVTIASAGGLFPMPVAPVYAASKAGVVHFVRSAAPGLFKRASVKLHAVCPEFVDTPLVRQVMDTDAAQARALLGADVAAGSTPLLSPSVVADLIIKLGTEPGTRPGTIALMRQDGRVEFPGVKFGLGGTSAAGAKGAAVPRPIPNTGADADLRAARAAWAVAGLPRVHRKWQVHTLGSDFKACTRLVEAPLPSTAPAGTLLLRRVWCGVNASDINYSAGRYHNSKAEAQGQLPYDCGFESVSIVAAVGEGVSGWAPGDVVATLSYDAFSEYGVAKAVTALRVVHPTPEAVALLTSGLTASIALEEAAQLKPKETVLVTAAAGGTGQFAVQPNKVRHTTHLLAQLAKLAGCRVVATAGGREKAALVSRLGADRVVDYKRESLKDVLKQEFPKGVDVVYEGVGGDMFVAALNALAPRGRLLVIGMMSAYAEGWPVSNVPGIPEKLLWKSAALVGFFLLRYAAHFKTHLARLSALVEQGKLHVAVDPTPFVGINSVPDAVAHLHSGSSMGKVVIRMASDLPPGPASTQTSSIVGLSRL